MDLIIYFIFYNIIPLCLYYLFFFLLVTLSALCLLVIHFEDPVYSVLTLTLVFLLTAFTLLLLNVEFLAYVYIIVYVGAVVLLFIFIIFMLGPVYTKSYREESFCLYYIFIAKFLVLFYIGVGDFVFFPGYHKYNDYSCSFLSNQVYSNDIIIFSNLLYTDHFYLFWMVALILLKAMIAPIIFHFNYEVQQYRRLLGHG
jgi:NADH-quinone oxidoreductase subunit J